MDEMRDTKGVRGDMGHEFGGAGEVRQDRRVNYGSIWGWGISLAIHLVIIFLIGSIAWTKSGSLEADGYDVGIVAGGSGGSIGLGGEGKAFSAGDASEVEVFVEESQTTDEMDVFVADASALGAAASIAVDIADSAAGAAGGSDWASLGSGTSGAGGGIGGANFFGLEAWGGKFVYVVDRSGSMKGAPLKRAKAEMVRSIKSLNKRIEFFVIFYSKGFMSMPAKSLVEATDENKAKYIQWISDVTADGTTEPTGAMKKALGLKPDAIWLLSDGKFNDSISDDIRNTNVDRVRIHTIAFFSREGEDVLKRIAAGSKGRYKFVRR